MKNKQIGLLILSMLVVQTLQSRQQQPSKAKVQVAPKHRSGKTSKNQDMQKSPQEIKPEEIVQPIKQETQISQVPLTESNNNNSVVTDLIRNPQNNTVTEEQITKTVDPVNNKLIIEKKSTTWTAIDYAKASAIAAGVIGLGVVAGYNLNPTFAGNVDNAGMQAKELGYNAYKKAGELNSSLQTKVYDAYEGGVKKAGELTTSFKNWRNPVAPAAPEMVATESAMPDMMPTKNMDNPAVAAPAEQPVQASVKKGNFHTHPRKALKGEFPKFQDSQESVAPASEIVADANSDEPEYNSWGLPMMTKAKKEAIAAQKAQDWQRFVNQRNRETDIAIALESKDGVMPSNPAEYQQQASWANRFGNFMNRNTDAQVAQYEEPAYQQRNRQAQAERDAKNAELNNRVSQKFQGVRSMLARSEQPVSADQAPAANQAEVAPESNQIVLATSAYQPSSMQRQLDAQEARRRANFAKSETARGGFSW